MKNKKALLVLVLMFVLMLTVAYSLYSQLGKNLRPDPLATQPSQSQDGSDTNEETTPKKKAPSFTVYNAEGLPVSLLDYKGKPIILNFWASWCAPCQMEMPHFQEKYLEYGDDIHFLMINMTDGSRETVESVNRFLEKHGYTFPVFYDMEYNAAIAYHAYSLPSTFFISAEGYVVAQANSAIDANQLQQGIDLIR